MEPKTLILIQNGQEVPCSGVVFHEIKAGRPGAMPRKEESPAERADRSRYLTATTSRPVNTAAATYARVGDVEIPVPFIRGATRKVITTEVRIDEPNASVLARELRLE